VTKTKTKAKPSRSIFVQIDGLVQSGTAFPKVH